LPKSEDPLKLALTLLAARSRTEAELLRALARKGVEPGPAHAAVARLVELRYMDDRQVAASRARSLVERGEAPRRAAQRLVRQGVAEASAAAAAADAREGASDDELAARALRRRLRGRPPADEAERRRLFRGLVGKGHRPAAAARALGLTWDGADEVDDGTDD
jgi:regulatory protein